MDDTHHWSHKLYVPSDHGSLMDAVNTASQWRQSLYNDYFKSRRLDPDSQSWSTWGATRASQVFGAVSLVHTVWVSGVAAAAWAAGMGAVVSEVTSIPADYAHGEFTRLSRVVVPHRQIDRVVAKIKHFRRCRNPEVFIDMIVNSYNCGFMSSTGSARLCNVLKNPQKNVDGKLKAIIKYLTCPPEDSEFRHLYRHNGKDLFRKIVAVTERMKLKGVR